MTDRPEHETHEDQLLLDAIDGDMDSYAIVSADHRLAALFEAMTANRDSIANAEPNTDPAVKADALAAAMSVFDDMQASIASAEAVAAVSARKRRSLRLFKPAGALAASAVVALGIVAIAPNLSGGSSDSTATDTANAVTASPSARAATASAAPESARAASQTTAVSADESSQAVGESDSMLSEPFASAEAVAEEPMADGAPDVDARLLECAAMAGIDFATWVSASDLLPQPSNGPYVRTAVILEDGLEIIVAYDPATCDINSVGDPTSPADTNR